VGCAFENGGFTPHPPDGRGYVSASATMKPCLRSQRSSSSMPASVIIAPRSMPRGLAPFANGDGGDRGRIPSGVVTMIVGTD